MSLQRIGHSDSFAIWECGRIGRRCRNKKIEKSIHLCLKSAIMVSFNTSVCKIKTLSGVGKIAPGCKQKFRTEILSHSRTVLLKGGAVAVRLTTRKENVSHAWEEVYLCFWINTDISFSPCWTGAVADRWRP